MTAKERNYVAECFRRNMKYIKSDVDYECLFNPDNREKIGIKAVEDERKRSINLIFGKEGKKSTKRPRPSVGMNLDDVSPSLRTMLSLEILIDIYTIRKHCNLNEEELDGNTKSFESALLANFCSFTSTDKFFGFLRTYLENVSEQERKGIVMLLLREFHLVDSIPKFYEFISLSINNMPRISEEELEHGFVSTFLLFPSGVILATSLLVHNEDLGNTLCDAFTREQGTSFVRGRYVWQFLSVLVSLVGDERRRSIVKKVRPSLLDIIKESNKEEIEYSKVFLDAIGIDLENIKA